MAKSQKKSNREIRKPKQAKAKTEAASRTFLGGLDRTPGSSMGAKKSTSP